MPRLPILSTLVVGLAVAAMLALGVWQLDRRAWKEALIARYADNLDRPEIAFPREPDPTLLYRNARAVCAEPLRWERRGGRGVDGTSGYRMIAECRTGDPAAPTLLVDAGVTDSPTFEPQWRGGAVTGTIVSAPGSTPALLSLFGGARETPRMMLVADTPAPGLRPSARPNPSDIPNNHLAYAVQWFAFAAIAVVIYLLALRLRRRRPGRTGR